MANRAINFELGLGLIGAECLEQSQRWILVAMQRHGQGVVTMLWRILGNEQDVCDVYQQTFLHLAHHKDRTKPENVRAYLYRTAANIAISTLRRSMVARRSVEVMAVENRQEINCDYAGDMDAKRLQEKLRGSIAKLPDYLREVIALRDLAELPYVQVGKILGIKEATARVYRYKAITLLSAWMAEKKNR